ncbi:MAG: hypothetical protein H0V05_19670, partial [Euzebyaceae bacterium]|nr:hypothetical protein [Euzebyaceae bacterium]
MSADARPSLGPGLDEPVEDRFGRGPVDEPFAGVEDPLADLPDDLLVDVADAVRDTTIREVLDRLDSELVALHEVKRRVREVAALLLVDRMRRKIGLDSEPPTLHMSFTGNPGTG